MCTIISAEALSAAPLDFMSAWVACG